MNQKNRKTITLAKLREWRACGDYDGADKGIDYWKSIGSPASLKKAIQICIDSKQTKRLDDANWLIVRMMNYQNCVLYAAHAAELVLDNFEREFPDDKRPRLAIEAARAFAKNPTEENKAAASAASAAEAAAWAAWAARAARAARAAESAESAEESRLDIQIKCLQYGIKLIYGKAKTK